MRRTYNYNISERANRSLARREAQVLTQKWCIALTVVFAVMVAVMWFSSIQVFEGEEEMVIVNKYYKTICVEAGDTLWDIAGEYVEGTDVSRQEYIEEVCELNGLNPDEIQAGEHIVVAYYELGK